MRFEPRVKPNPTISEFELRHKHAPDRFHREIIDQWKSPRRFRSRRKTMRADKLTVNGLFDPTERRDAPLFQRPYVWNQKQNHTFL